MKKINRRDFLKVSLAGGIGAGSGLITMLSTCGRKPVGPEDTESPVVSLESNKTQYNKKEDVYFTGLATDNIKVVEEGIDIDAGVNSDGIGGTDDDRDLESLTSTLSGGYDLAGKYEVIGWAKDDEGNIGSKELTLVVKPYSQFAEVQDSLTELASHSKIIKEITLDDFELLYSMLSADAKNELDVLNGLIASSTIDAAAKYNLTDKGLVYEMNITDANKFTGFTNDSYFGDLLLSQSTYNELHKNLMENSTEEEALALIAGLAPEGASIDHNQLVALPGLAPLNFDIVIRYVENGQEVNLSLEYKSPGDTFSTEEQERVDAFNSMFHPPYFPISALGIEETTPLDLKKIVLQEIQYHQDNI